MFYRRAVRSTPLGTTFGPNYKAFWLQDFDFFVAGVVDLESEIDGRTEWKH